MNLRFHLKERLLKEGLEPGEATFFVKNLEEKQIVDFEDSTIQDYRIVKEYNLLTLLRKINITKSNAKSILFAKIEKKLTLKTKVSYTY